MGEPPTNLAVMNLRARGVNDETLGYGGWIRKEQLHVRAKANDYQTNKPNDDGDWWGFQAPGSSGPGQAPRCNLPTAVAKISARIPATGGAQQKDIDEQVFLIRDEMGPWNASQMMSCKAIESNFTSVQKPTTIKRTNPTTMEIGGATRLLQHQIQVRLRAVTFLRRLPRLVPASRPPGAPNKKTSTNKCS